MPDPAPPPPPPVALRERIISALTTAVGGQYGVPAPEDERDLPITIVEDQPESASEDQYGFSVIVLPVIVASAAAATSTNRNTVRAQANGLLASIVQTVFANAPLGLLVDGIEYTGGGIQTEIGKFVFAEAQFSIRYHTVRGNPFASETPEPDDEE